MVDVLKLPREALVTCCVMLECNTFPVDQLWPFLIELLASISSAIDSRDQCSYMVPTGNICIN